MSLNQCVCFCLWRIMIRPCERIYTTKKKKRCINLNIHVIIFYWLIEQWAGKMCESFINITRLLYLSLYIHKLWIHCQRVQWQTKRKRVNQKTEKLNPIDRPILTIHVITYEIIDYKITHIWNSVHMIEAVMCAKNAACLYCFLCMRMCLGVCVCIR